MTKWIRVVSPLIFFGGGIYLLQVIFYTQSSTKKLLCNCNEKINITENTIVNAKSRQENFKLSELSSHHLEVCRNLQNYLNTSVIYFTPSILASKGPYILHESCGYFGMGIGSLFTKIKIVLLLSQIDKNLKVLWNPEFFITENVHKTGNMMHYFVPDLQNELSMLAWICNRLKTSNIESRKFNLDQTSSKNTPCLLASLKGEVRSGCFEEHFKNALTSANNTGENTVFVLKNCPSLDHWNNKLVNTVRSLYEQVYESSIQRKSRKSSKFLNIAIHIRRGDITTENFSQAYVENKYYVQLLTTLFPLLHCESKQPMMNNIQVNLFSQGKPDDFVNISRLHDNTILHLGNTATGGLIETIDQISHADILLTSKGGFTHLLASLSPENTIKLVVPYWQDYDGIENVVSVTENTVEFDKSKFAELFRTTQC